ARSELALHDVDALRGRRRSESHGASRRHDCTRVSARHAVARATELDVRTKRARVQRIAQRRTRAFDVVLQQFEFRLWCHTHPYDARRAKVWERAEAAQAEGERAVRSERGAECVAQRAWGGVGLLAQELEGDVKMVVVEPFHGVAVLRRVTHRGRSRADVAAN